MVVSTLFPVHLVFIEEFVHIHLQKLACTLNLQITNYQQYSFYLPNLPRTKSIQFVFTTFLPQAQSTFQRFTHLAQAGQLAVVEDQIGNFAELCTNLDFYQTTQVQHYQLIWVVRECPRQIGALETKNLQLLSICAPGRIRARLDQFRKQHESTHTLIQSLCVV